MARTPLPWLAGLLAVYLVVPLIAFGARLAGTPGGPPTTPGLGAALDTSLLTATIATSVIAVLGIPMAYLLARSRGRGGALLTLLVQLPIALPPLISGILLLYVVGPYTWLGRMFGGNLTDDTTGIVLAQIFVAAPFLVIAARSAFAAVDPALLDTAATLGHGPLARFTKVALPLAAPGIRAGLLLAWLRSFGEFGATIILAYHPYSLPVYTFVQFGSTGLSSTMLPTAAALGAALTVTALAAYIPRRLMKARDAVLPPPRPPRRAAGERLDFDLDAGLGRFRLRVAHRQHADHRHLAALGPSGAGKSLMIRLIAGLADTDHGHVRLGDDDLTRQPPARRAVGYLPQDPCLLPHRTVWRQIIFGAGTDPAVAAYWLDVLGLRDLANRLPDQLSGGQRRRVALARALAREPRLLLLDEPLTGLDTPVRDELRRELRRLQRTTGLTTVLVTHDPDEAALLADELLVLIDGAVAQAGAQAEVFRGPATAQVARLLGARNMSEGRVSADGTLTIAGCSVPVDPERAAAGSRVLWSFDPHAALVEPDEQGAARIIDVVRLGSITELLLSLDGAGEFAVVTAHDCHLPVGSRCAVTVRADAVSVWPAGNGPDAEGRPVARAVLGDITEDRRFARSAGPRPGHPSDHC